MIGFVADAEISKVSVQSVELIVNIGSAHFRSAALSTELGTHALVLGKERFQVEPLLVGFVERVGVSLQPSLQPREYLDIVL